MPLRFYHGFRAGAFRMNLSKGDVSWSVGGRSAWFTIGNGHARTSIGLPGTGDDQCSARSEGTRGVAGLGALASGHDSSRPLHVYRDGALVLRVHSIGEAAGLRVPSHDVGFESVQQCTAASPMRFPDWAAT